MERSAVAEQRDSERNVWGVGIPAGQRLLVGGVAMRQTIKRGRRPLWPLLSKASRPGAPTRWDTLLGGSVEARKAWTCVYCGVIGSHRRGCHYVTETHHRGPKRVRRGILGGRARQVGRASV